LLLTLLKNFKMFDVGSVAFAVANLPMALCRVLVALTER
jgi:hypothetical protein